jgi:hypothetical protein
VNRNYEKLVIAAGLEVGDAVKVAFAVPSRSMGWGGDWSTSYMEGAVDNVYRVEDVDSEGCMQLSYRDSDGDSYYFPVHCLEKVDQSELPEVGPDIVIYDYQVKFLEDGSLTIGCINVSYEEVRTIADHAEKKHAASVA